MSAEMHSAGERLFARYAFQPNDRGYCGPEDAPLAAVARGGRERVDVPAIARRFSGAWPYLTVIGAMLGCDPLDERAVRAYWTGSADTDDMDAAEFWSRLVAIIGPRAGAYWTYVDDRLAPEAAPHHAFHVFGVYPWSRLLDAGVPEPLEVLESCAVVPGRVVAVDADAATCTVSAPRLVHADGRLALGAEEERGVTVPFGDVLAVGDRVALHWDSVCERLEVGAAAALRARLEDQLARVNARPAGG